MIWRIATVVLFLYSTPILAADALERDPVREPEASALRD